MSTRDSQRRVWRFFSNEDKGRALLITSDIDLSPQQLQDEVSSPSCLLLSQTPPQTWTTFMAQQSNQVPCPPPEFSEGTFVPAQTPTPTE